MAGNEWPPGMHAELQMHAAEAGGTLAAQLASARQMTSQRQKKMGVDLQNYIIATAVKIVD